MKVPTSLRYQAGPLHNPLHQLQGLREICGYGCRAWDLAQHHIQPLLNRTHQAHQRYEQSFSRTPRERRFLGILGRSRCLLHPAATV